MEKDIQMEMVETTQLQMHQLLRYCEKLDINNHRYQHLSDALQSAIDECEATLAVLKRETNNG